MRPLARLCLVFLFPFLCSAASLWPMWGQNQYHTSLSGVSGPGRVPTLRFSAVTGGQATSSVIDDRGNVFFCSTDGIIYAYNGSNGMQLWRYPTEALLEYAPVINPATAAVCAGNGAGPTTFHCITSSTGSLLWATSLRGHTLSSETVVSEDGTMYFGDSDGNLWSLTSVGVASVYPPPPTAGGPVSGAPVILPSGNIAHSTAGYVSVVTPALQQLWGYEYNSSGPDSQSFSTSAGALYLASSVFGPTGSTGVLWALRVNASVPTGPLWSTPVSSFSFTRLNAPGVDGSGNLYAGCGSAMYAYTPGGALRWSYAVTGLVFGGLTLDDLAVYFGTQSGRVYALSQSSGALLWSFQTPADSISSSPAIAADGTLWIGSDATTVFALSVHGSPSPSPKRHAVSAVIVGSVIGGAAAFVLLVRSAMLFCGPRSSRPPRGGQARMQNAAFVVDGCLPAAASTITCDPTVLPTLEVLEVPPAPSWGSW